MQHGQRRYVLLRFAPDRKGRSDTAIPLLLVQSAGKLNIHLVSQWESRVDPKDREYLTGLLDDWRAASAKAIPAILDQLSELSIGPLQAVESGIADPERLRTLLQQFSHGS